MTIHAVASLRRLIMALTIGLPIGFVIGVLSSLGELPRRTVSLIVAILLPIPGMALIPAAIVLFGFGDLSIVVVSMIGAFAPMAHSLIAGFESLPKEIVESAWVDGCNRLSSLLYVQLPMMKSSLMVGIRLGLVKCWRTVIATEFVAAVSAGLGYNIQDAAEYLRFDLIFLSIIVLSVICRVLDGFIVLAFGE